MSRKHQSNSGASVVTPIEVPQSAQSQASVWLAKLDGDKPSDALLLEFKYWVNQDESHYAAFKKVSAAWGDLNILTRLPLLIEERAQQQVQKKVKSKLVNKARLPLWLNGSWSGFGGLAVAASLVFAVFVSLQLGPFKAAPTVYWTAIGEQKTITLADNTVVQLNTNSRIQVDYSQAVRAIYLHQGEAHFDVESNAQRPFEVYVGTGRVRAIGTAFSVRLNDNDIGVVVTEGVVEIAPEIAPEMHSYNNALSTTLQTSNGADSSIAQSSIVQSTIVSGVNDLQQLAQLQRVEAGSAAVFNQQAVTLIEPLDETALQRSQAWQQGLLMFSGEPLEEVVSQLSRYTDLKIVIQSERARHLRIGGQFQIGDTQAVFTALEKGFGLKANYVTNSLVYLSYQEPNRELH